MKQPAPLPSAELKALGEKLQQAIVLTKMRVEGLKPSRVQAKASRIMTSAEKLFVHVAQVVHATQGLAGFLEKTLGVTVDDLFSMTGKDRLARGTAYAGMAAVNELVKRQIDELAAVNAAIDEEVKHGCETGKA